ncbi:hypothetical protein pb186bvf_002696 [Paramecium bursaria]
MIFHIILTQFIQVLSQLIHLSTYTIRQLDPQIDNNIFLIFLQGILTLLLQNNFNFSNQEKKNYNEITTLPICASCQSNISNNHIKLEHFLDNGYNYFELILINILFILAQILQLMSSKFLLSKGRNLQILHNTLTLITYWYCSFSFGIFAYLVISWIILQIKRKVIDIQTICYLLMMASMGGIVGSKGLTFIFEPGMLGIIILSFISLALISHHQEDVETKSINNFDSKCDVTLPSLIIKYKWLKGQQAYIVDFSLRVAFSFSDQETPQFSETEPLLILEKQLLVGEQVKQLREILLEYGVIQDADGFHCYKIPESRDKLNLIIDDSYANIRRIKRNKESTCLLEFSHSLSHELSTCLNCIITLSDVALNNESISQTLKQQVFEPILFNSKQLELIVNNLKDYSLIKTNNYMSQIQKCNLMREIRDILDYYKMVLAQKKLQIKFKQNVEQLIVYVDKNRLRQVIYQLLSNSIRFSNQGKITITLRNDQNNQVMLKIKDPGVGMSSSEQFRLQRLIDQQILSRVSPHSVGCGLGLNISNLICQKLSDPFSRNLKFKSQQNKGSSFKFWVTNNQINQQISMNSSAIKLLSSISYQDNQFDSIYQIDTIKYQQSKKSQQSKGQPPSQENSSFLNVSDLDEEIHIPPALIAKQQQPKEPRIQFIDEPCCSKVLLVDDEYFNMYALEAIMNQMNIKCDQAFNGQEAIDKIVEKSQNECVKCRCRCYLLYVIDINMPIKDGNETVIEIRQMMNNKQITKTWCIACSAFLDFQHKQHSLQIGFDYYLTKPLDTQLLKQIIKKLYFETQS